MGICGLGLIPVGDVKSACLGGLSYIPSPSRCLSGQHHRTLVRKLRLQREKYSFIAVEVIVTYSLMNAMLEVRTAGIRTTSLQVNDINNKSHHIKITS